MMDVLIQTKQQMNETVSFPTNGCTIVTKNRTHCAEVPTQIDCQERTVFIQALRRIFQTGLPLLR